MFFFATKISIQLQSLGASTELEATVNIFLPRHLVEAQKKVLQIYVVFVQVGDSKQVRRVVEEIGNSNKQGCFLGQTKNISIL